MGEIADKIADEMDDLRPKVLANMAYLQLDDEVSEQFSFRVNLHRVKLYADLAYARALHCESDYSWSVSERLKLELITRPWYSSDPWNSVPPSVWFVKDMNRLVSAEMERVHANDQDGGLPQECSTSEVTPANLGYQEAAAPDETEKSMES